MNIGSFHTYNDSGKKLHDTRTVNRFLLIPRIVEGKWCWLKRVNVHQEVGIVTVEEEVYVCLGFVSATEIRQHHVWKTINRTLN